MEDANNCMKEFSVSFRLRIGILLLSSKMVFFFSFNSQMALGMDFHKGSTESEMGVSLLNFTAPWH